MFISQIIQYGWFCLKCGLIEVCVWYRLKKWYNVGNSFKLELEVGFHKHNVEKGL